MTLAHAKPLVWLLLALPAVWWTWQLAHGELAMHLEAPSGIMAVRLAILALLPGPLSEAFGANRVFRGWLALRRSLGLAGFAYALLHLAFYLADMAALAPVVEELGLPAIWTGWLALALLAPPAAISFDAAQRALRRRWQQVQYCVYAALACAFAHWLLLDWAWQPAAMHFAPLVFAWAARAVRRVRRPSRRWSPT